MKTHYICHKVPIPGISEWERMCERGKKRKEEWGDLGGRDGNSVLFSKEWDRWDIYREWIAYKHTNSHTCPQGLGWIHYAIVSLCFHMRRNLDKQTEVTWVFLLEVNNAYNVSILYVNVSASVFECVRQIITAVLVSVDQQYITETFCFIYFSSTYSSLTLKHIQIQ